LNGRNAKKIRKELAQLKKNLVEKERKAVADGFRVFINKLTWWNRLKLCKEIMRRRF
jgi:hypothetical protein